MRHAMLCLAVVGLSACGGGSNTPTNTPPPTTQPPPPNYSGTYNGIGTLNVSGQAEVRPSSRVTVTHSGSLIQMSDLVVTLAGQTVSFPMGQAAISGDAFTGTHAYQSAGCGLAAVQTTGRFAGNLINLQAVITLANCAQSRFVGELSR